ncbi:uncharacterized protein [Linepithema humile]|uniref:uncharacterized protein n=1 Tax=Linepithema humile TaxID=83485 RepID=UPI00351E8B23
MIQRLGRTTRRTVSHTAFVLSITLDPIFCYRIIEFFTVFTALSDILVCRNCKQNIKFEETGIRGLGFKIVVKCKCGSRNINSDPLINTGYEINRRIVFVMRLLGVGRQGLQLFCNYMDICSGISEDTYNRIYGYIYSAAKSIFDYCCKKAVDEEKQENEKREIPITNFKVSGDGSWKKRGFKSLYGVTTLIAYYTGKIIDLVIKSSYCHACAQWKNKSTNSEEYLAWKAEHDEEICTKTHEGSAGGMEVESMKTMFLRSNELHGVKYVSYIGDGDSKTFSALLKINPYGDEQTVVKSECVGHVQKRMGSRLRNVRKAKKLGGKGKLTEVLIKKLSTYYGLAIRRNVNSVQDMKKAIMATFYHMISTDENPRHENCPTGSDSWCQWQRATALGNAPESHPQPLHHDVQKELLPIYEDLSRDDLLTRCLGGHTQNANESFNSTIWRLAPKHLHCGLKIVEVASYIAAVVFNEGNSSILMMMNELQIVVGSLSFNFGKQTDEQRVKRQNRRSSLETKEARIARKKQMLAANLAYEEEEGLLYGAGIDD